jgi:type I restriction enzyme S subunit
MTAELPKSLNDACEFIVDCLHATAPTESDGYPLIRTPNVGRGRLDLEDVYRVSEDTYKTWTKRAVPQPDDLILAREAPAGNVAIVKEGQTVCLGQRTVHLRPNKAKVDPDFLCYFLLAPPQQGKLLAGETGATAKHVNMKDIRRLELTGMPGLQAQKAAGSLLAAYDDLIENNRRRMALLEDAARQLYREWFVRLRFPGYEHTRITDGVPHGWTRQPLGQCAKLLSGGTPSKARAEFWEGEIPWVSSGELTAMRIHRTSLNITSEAVDAGSRLVPAETILAVVRGMSLAKEFRIGITARPMAFNQDLKAISSEANVDALLLFHALESQRDQIRDKAGEASHGTKKLDSAVLTELPVLVPSQSLQRQFREHIEPLHQQWDNLVQQSDRLRSARDLLLPRLMSGEISV